MLPLVYSFTSLDILVYIKIFVELYLLQFNASYQDFSLGNYSYFNKILVEESRMSFPEFLWIAD